MHWKGRAVDDVADTDTLAGGQLAQIIDKQATMATDIAVILERTAVLKALQDRVTALELFRARLSGMWMAAAIMGAIAGAAMGWLVTYLTRR